MSDDRIESELRAWFSAQAEPDLPPGLRAFLADLPTSRPGLDRVVRPRPAPIADRRRRGVLRALVACLLVAAIALAVGFGLDRRPGPSVGLSPSPSMPPASANGSTGPSTSTVPSMAPVAGTPVVDAAPVDAGHGWALTNDDLVWTNDAGATWTSIKPPGVMADTIRAVHFLSPISGWVASSSEATGAVTVERTNDEGRTWSASHIPDRYPDGVGNVSIDAVDGGTVWVQVESVHSSASSIGGLALSLDGGISWEPGITIPGGWPIRFVSASNGWTTARPLRDELDATTDGGRTWHPVSIDRLPGHAQDAMSFDLPTFIGDGGPGMGVLPVTLYTPLDPSGADQTATLALYTTADGGATWQFATTVGATTAPSQPLTITSAILDRDTWLAMSDPVRPTLSKTSDGGRTWTDTGSIGLEPMVDSLRFVDGTNGWALTQPGGADYQLSSTTDGGRTWRPLDPVARPVVAPSPTASSAGPAGGPYRWTLANSEGELATYSIQGVLRRRDGGYLALGVGQEPRLLTSHDGRTWTIEPRDAALFAATADHVSLVNGLAEGARRFVAVGATALDDISSGDARAWTSSDGLAWQAAASVTGGVDAAMLAVTAGSSGFVAVGSDGFPGGNVQLPGARGVAVWTSADGTDWTRVPAQPSFAGAIMNGVLRVDAGFVAWGQTLVGGPRTPASPIWTSRDGVRWERSTGVTDAGGPGAPIASIAGTGDRLVAVGTRQLPDAEGASSVPGAWTSTDGGRTWKAATIHDDGPGGARSGGMSDVTSDGNDLVAVGRLDPPGGQLGPASAAVWRSSDQGSTWTRLTDDPAFAGASMRHVLTATGGLVVFGQADDPNAFADAELIWTAEAVASP